VQKHAMRAWKDDLSFRELVMNDPEITARVPARQIEQAFSIERQLRNVGKIFKRVFGE
jgi:adenylosuccinate lyase